MTGPTQVAQLQKALAELRPTPQPSGTEPRVLIKSPLQLTREQEDNLLQHGAAQLRNVSRELGRLDYSAATWAQNVVREMASSGQDTTPFMAERHLAHMLLQGRVDWRRQLLGGIYHESNQHLPIIGRILPQQIARAQNNFFGTKPWMTAKPIGVSDADLSDKVMQWCRHMADKAEVEATLREAIALAMVQGEQVVKLHHDKRLDYYQTVKEIAIQPDGQPFVADDGDYVFRTDTWDPVPPPIDPLADPNTPVPPETMVLRRDGTTLQPDWWNNVTFAASRITRINERFNGPRVTNVFYQDFLCSRYASSIQEAPECFHILTQSLIGFVHTLLTDSKWKESMPGTEDQIDTIARILQEFSSGDGAQNADSAGEVRPRPDLKEGSTGSTTSNNVEPMLTLVECWMHMDVNGDGLAESILLIMDRNGNVPVYYDYVANITPDGLRPFDVLRVNPVAGRWHGIGQVTKFYQLQELADLLFNRINYAISSAGRIDVFDPDALIETEGDHKLELNGGLTYRLAPGKQIDKVLQSYYLTNVNIADLRAMLEQVIQMATNMSGVANANDGNMAGLNSSELATGVNNIERSGMELFASILNDLLPPISRLTKRFLLFVCSDLPKKKKQVFLYFEGDAQSLIELDPDQLRDLDLHVLINLSQTSGQEAITQVQSLQVIYQQLVSHPAPWMILGNLPIALEAAKKLGIPHAERLLPNKAQLEAWLGMVPAMPGAPPMATAAPPPPAANAAPTEATAPAPSVV